MLNSFSLKVPAGKSAALVGDSGSGKSTVVGLLLRFYDPSGGGRVTLDGHDLRFLRLDWFRSHIGLVNQEPVLFAMTIAENIGFGRDGEYMVGPSFFFLVFLGKRCILH